MQHLREHSERAGDRAGPQFKIQETRSLASRLFSVDRVDLVGVGEDDGREEDECRRDGYRTHADEHAGRTVIIDQLRAAHGKASCDDSHDADLRRVGRPYYQGEGARPRSIEAARGDGHAAALCAPARRTRVPRCP